MPQFFASGLTEPAETNRTFILAEPTTKVIFTIKSDGSVELGEGASMDEASAAFWDYVLRHRPSEGIEKDTRNARLEALSDAIGEFSFGRTMPEVKMAIHALYQKEKQQ